MIGGESICGKIGGSFPRPAGLNTGCPSGNSFLFCFGSKTSPTQSGGDVEKHASGPVPRFGYGTRRGGVWEQDLIQDCRPGLSTKSSPIHSGGA